MSKCRVYGVLIGCFFSFCADALVPVKRTNSLGMYKEIHDRLSEASIASLCDSLNEKLKILRNIGEINAKIIKDVERLKAIEDTSYFKAVGVPRVKQSVDVLHKKRCEALTDAMKPLGMASRRSVSVESFSRDLIAWRDEYLRKVFEGIKKGEYSLLVSPLPDGLLMDGYVPNTFSCAISFVTDSNERVDVYLDSAKTSLKISSVPTLFSFKSGNNDDASDFCNYSLREQSNALTGDLSKNPGKIKGPDDLFRHSEQQAFFSLRVDPCFIGEIKEKLKGKKIKEIVFHGNTLRDMCPNCRSTLVGYEMLSIRNALYKQLSVDNILCTLQEAVVESTGGEKPPVTCLISSFIDYQVGYRDRDVSWILQPSYNLLDVNDKAPSGLCTNFVNQYSFSKSEFLLMLSKYIVDEEVKEVIRERIEEIKEGEREKEEK